MESLLNGIPGVIVYIDDILVTGMTTEEHLKALDKVLSRLEKAGLCLQKTEVLFMQTSVTYLGHYIAADGIRPVPEKVEPVRQAPQPKNAVELRSYLGLLTYYSKFLPNMSAVLATPYTGYYAALHRGDGGVLSIKHLKHSSNSSLLHRF